MKTLTNETSKIGFVAVEMINKFCLIMFFYHELTRTKQHWSWAATKSYEFNDDVINQHYHHTISEQILRYLLAKVMFRWRDCIPDLERPKWTFLWDQKSLSLENCRQHIRWLVKAWVLVSKRFKIFDVFA